MLGAVQKPPAVREAQIEVMIGGAECVQEYVCAVILHIVEFGVSEVGLENLQSNVRLGNGL